MAAASASVSMPVSPPRVCVGLPRARRLAATSLRTRRRTWEARLDGDTSASTSSTPHGDVSRCEGAEGAAPWWSLGRRTGRLTGAGGDDDRADAAAEVRAGWYDGAGKPWPPWLALCSRSGAGCSVGVGVASAGDDHRRGGGLTADTRRLGEGLYNLGPSVRAVCADRMVVPDRRVWLDAAVATEPASEAEVKPRRGVPRVVAGVVVVPSPWSGLVTVITCAGMPRSSRMSPSESDMSPGCNTPSAACPSPSSVIPASPTSTGDLPRW